LEADAQRRGRTEQDAGAPKAQQFRTKSVTTGRLGYRESGMPYSVSTDDSAEVNVHGTMPALWVKAVMVSLNLLVWVDAAARLAG
jgi:hypothetical protein